MDMLFPPLTGGFLLERINRYTAMVGVEGREESTHISNTGRMTELLNAGASIGLSEHNSEFRS